MATIVAAHDISGIGRCSLVAAISVLSAMGHHVCPVPTAVLSKQTAFPGYSCVDFTPHIPNFLQDWNDEALSPDLIFTGFLGSYAQPGLLLRYLSQHTGATVVVDPVLGDHGRLYPCYDSSFLEQMLQLVQKAHLITPNETEFRLLTGHPADAPLPDDDALLLTLAGRLRASNLTFIVITGACLSGAVYNIILDLKAQQVHRFVVAHTGVSYSGTGDLFASAFCGCIARRLSVQQAVQLAAAFIAKAIAATPAGQDPRYGVCYEPFLCSLSPTALSGGVYDV